MAFKLDGKTLPVGVPFTSNGVNYPANWLQLTTLDEKKAIGITEVADAPTFDQRFYWNASTAKKLADEDAKDTDGNLVKDQDGNQVINKGLKTRYIELDKQAARNFLETYDWYIVRKTEKDIAIPSAVTTYRDAIRTTCATRETEINNCSDVEALKTLLDNTITDWPEPPS